MIYNIYLLLLLVTGVPLLTLVIYFRWWLVDWCDTVYFHVSQKQANSFVQDKYNAELLVVEKHRRVTGLLIFVFEILFSIAFLMYAWDFFLGTGGNTYLYYILLSLFPLWRLFGLLLVYWDYKPKLRKLKGVHYKAIATFYYIKNGEFYLHTVTDYCFGVKWFMPYDEVAMEQHRETPYPDEKGGAHSSKQTFASIGAIWGSKIFTLDNFVEPSKEEKDENKLG